MICLVTGSSRGLGKSIALAFGKKGFKVAVHYNKDREGAERTAGEIKDPIVLKGDVGNSEDAQAIVKGVTEKWGRVDVLVNNAGITKESLLIRTSADDFMNVININLKGAFNMTSAVAKQMMKHKKGHIINISSYAGIKGGQGLSAYASSKAALTGLTKTAAVELGRYNVMVNAILPGYMMTDMGQSSNITAREQAIGESILNALSKPRSVAEFICCLVNTDGITGQIFNLDSRII